MVVNNTLDQDFLIVATAWYQLQLGNKNFDQWAAATEVLVRRGLTDRHGLWIEPEEEV